ncbi:MAG: acetylxylan esterase [Defluviitaleaceae bacterium]|nr:acetylxylan esterase [Defluviitaleaceae bacterium]
MTHEIPHDNGYFTSLAQLAHVFKTQGCASRFGGTTAADLAAWQTEKRAILRDLLGFHTFEDFASPPTHRVYTFNSEDCGTYTRTKMVLQTEAFVYMPFFVLRPHGLATGERRPAVICPNGHFNRAKESVAAVRHVPGVLEDMADAHTHHAEDFVQRGYIAFCPDVRGFGERAERATQGGYECSCTHLNRMGIPLGRSALGMQVYDLVKLIDYIETRDDCDPTRISAAGLSGGGMLSMYLAAADTRIACACTSGYFFGVLESRLHRNTHCDCNYVPGMWRHFDMGDIAALIAPRSFIVETGTWDDSNGIGDFTSAMENVYTQVQITAHAYVAAGASERFKHSVQDVGHRWVGADVYPFFDAALTFGKSD